MAATTETRTALRICPLCEACCGLELRIQGDKVVGVRGHEADVFSAGYICPKGVALKELHEDPDRLRTPLVKRDGRFVEASWEEAFDEIERRLVPILERHGRDALAVSIGNPSAHKMSLLLYFTRVARAFGTKNVYSASTLDQMPKQLSSGLMFGHWLSIAVPDIERSDFLLILGANPMASNGSLWTVPTSAARPRRCGRAAGASSWSTRAAPRRRQWPTPTTSSGRAAMSSCSRRWCTRCSTRTSCASAASSRTWRASTRCAQRSASSRPRRPRPDAASTRRRSGRWRAISRPRGPAASTAASAPARRPTAASPPGWSTCSTC